MSAAFSDTAFGKNTAFSDAAFAFGTSVITSTGGHFGGRRRKRRDEDVSHSITAREKLRADIKRAIDGPEYVSEAVLEALQPFTRTQATDSILVPLVQRIDWDAFGNRMDEIESVLTQAIRQGEEDDEDEDLLLLH